MSTCRKFSIELNAQVILEVLSDSYAPLLRCSTVSGTKNPPTTDWLRPGPGERLRSTRVPVVNWVYEYQHSIFDRNLNFVESDMRCEAGYFYLPTGPGLGVNPRRELFDFVM